MIGVYEPQIGHFDDTIMHTGHPKRVDKCKEIWINLVCQPGRTPHCRCATRGEMVCSCYIELLVGIVTDEPG